MGIAPVLLLSLAGVAAYVACGRLTDRVLDRTVGWGEGYPSDRVLCVVAWPTVATSLLMLGILYVACQPGKCRRAVARWLVGKEKS
jgi:hypothetical protein